MPKGEHTLTTSLTIFIYLVLLLNIFLVAAHLTKKKFNARRRSAEDGLSETPFVESLETVEFQTGEPDGRDEVRVLLPSGYEHRLLLCRSGDISPDVRVYVAKGITLILDPLQTIREAPRTTTYDCEACLQFPDGQTYHVTRCYGGSTDNIDIEVYAAAGITLIVKIMKLVNY